MYSLCSGLAGLLTILLGLTVLFKNKASNEARTFALLCLAIFYWLVSYAVMTSSSDASSALFFARVGHSGVIFAVITYLHFTRYFLNMTWLKPFYKIYYPIGVMFLYLLWTDSRFITGIVKQPWGYYPAGGPLMLMYAIGIIAVVALCWPLFVVACERARRAGAIREYNRLKYGCLALTVFSLGALDYLPKFGIQYYPLGFITTTIFVSIVSYAILVHHLMDINIVLRKSLVYSVLAGIITAIYFSFVLMAEKILQGVVGYRSLLGSIIAGFTIALTVNPLKETIQRFVDHLFFRENRIALVEENERLKSELVRSEKLKAVATLAAGMAHEIKNPLTSIKTFAEYLPQKHDDPIFREKFARIVGQEVGKINDLVQRLLDFAKPNQPQKRCSPLSDFIDDTVDFLQQDLLSKHIEVVRAYNPQDQVLVDPTQMKQVFLNVLLNSIEAMEKPGIVRISTAQNNGSLEVTVSDTGPGISHSDLRHVFDPFYTTKRFGTGLGLSVVHSIVTQHGGQINIESQPGQGTSVKITLPSNNGKNG